MNVRHSLDVKHFDAINIKIQDMLQSESASFKSIHTFVDENESVNFPIEILYSLSSPGPPPPHNLELKVGSLIILLRNLNGPKLCNRSRLEVRKFLGNIIEATILNGKF